MRELLPEEIAVATSEMTEEEYVTVMRRRLKNGESPKPKTFFGQRLLFVAAMRNLGSLLNPFMRN